MQHGDNFRNPTLTSPNDFSWSIQGHFSNSLDGVTSPTGFSVLIREFHFDFLPQAATDTCILLSRLLKVPTSRRKSRTVVATIVTAISTMIDSFCPCYYSLNSKNVVAKHFNVAETSQFPCQGFKDHRDNTSWTVNQWKCSPGRCSFPFGRKERIISFDPILLHATLFSSTCWINLLRLMGQADMSIIRNWMKTVQTLNGIHPGEALLVDHLWRLIPSKFWW